MGWIRRASFKGLLMSPSLILQVYLLVHTLKGLGNRVVREHLNLMISRSNVFQMRQETGLVLFLKAQHGITPQRERTLSQRLQPNAETASFSAWNCRTVSKLAYRSRGMFQWQATRWWPLKKFLRHPGSISSLFVLILCFFCTRDIIAGSLRAPGLAL